jgi:hypothetical protein
MTTNHEVRPGYSLQNMVTAAHADLPPTPHAGHGTDTPHVFLAFLRLYEHGPIEPLQSLLDKSGLSYDWRHFYASEGVTVYRVWRSQERSAVPAFPQLNIYEFADNWQITVPGEHLPPSFSRALQLRLDALPTSPKDVGDYAAISFILGSSSAEGGLAIAEAGIKNFPDSGELALARGTMLFLLNRPEEARAEWRKASERISSSLHASLGSVIDLAIEGRFNESHEGFERLQQLSGGTFEPLLGEALAKFADEDK